MKLLLRLVLPAGLEALGELAPRAHRVLASATALGFALTATVRVVDRVHDHAADGRADAQPAAAAGLAATKRSCARRCRPGRWWRSSLRESCGFRRRAASPARSRLRGCSGSPAGRRCGRSGRRGPATSSTLWIARAERDGLQRKRIAELRLGALSPAITLAPTFRPIGREDVSLLAVRVLDKRDARGAVRIVLDRRSTVGHDVTLACA